MDATHSSRFVNETTMNEYTLREILLALWKDKASRHIAPVVIYLVVVIGLMVYAFATGKSEFMLLAGAIGLAGLAVLVAYAAVFGIRSARKREQLIRQVVERYGDQPVLTVWIGDDIRYRFAGTERTVPFTNVERIAEIEMYLILRLKDGMNLPIWKAGFTQGSWEDFIPYIKQRTGKQ